VLLADRRRVYDELHRRGIRVQVHYVPVHHHPISRDIHLPADGLPACDDVYERILSLPIFPELTEKDQDGVVQALEDILA
jgi:perosamine synthetase